MRHWISLLFLPALLLMSVQSPAQDAVCHTRIALLTCAPGNELYTTFGHTALRVQDSLAQTDLVYNFGTFDFDEPGFYWHFLQGKLYSFLSVSYYSSFLAEYKHAHRTVREQTLYLSNQEKEEIIRTLRENSNGTNRRYPYHFLFENCTTRVRDLIFGESANIFIQKKIVADGTSSRDLIHTYLDRGGKPWSKLVIDILSGAGMDTPVGNRGAMFLPDYLRKGADVAVAANRKPLVRGERVLFAAPAQSPANNKNLPLLLVSFLSVAALVLYQLPGRGAKAAARLVDSLLLYLTGLAGLFLTFLGWGTDLGVTRENYNLLWALPCNIIAFLFFWRSPFWLRAYFYVAFALTAGLLTGWWWLPQKLNPALLPFVLLLLYRYGSLAGNKKSTS